MNWKQTIAEIQRHGLTQPQIAAICGCGQATISDLAKGKTTDPRHSLGQSLLKLLAERNAADPGISDKKPAAPTVKLLSPQQPRRLIPLTTPDPVQEGV